MTDNQIHKLIQFLKEKQLDKNTMITFTCDNGCSPAANFKELREVGHDPSAGFRGAKADIYEGGHRVPFIVRRPGVVCAGSKNNSTICLTDFMATCAEFLDATLNDSTVEDSFSLLPLFKESASKPFQRVNTIHHSIDGNFAIRKGDWKLALCRGSGGWSAPTESQAKKDHSAPIQLYNLKDDPAEQINVKYKFPELIHDLKNELETVIRKGHSRIH